ncbi:MAG: hypothetical protein NVS2B7_30590 [Herpetosiphon sp.]
MTSNKGLSKLFGRRSQPPVQTASALRDLAKLAEERTELADLTRAAAALLQAAYADVIVIPFPFSSERVATHTARGVPLLQGEPLPIEGRWLAAQFIRVCNALVEQKHPTARPILDAAKRGTFDVVALSDQLVLGEPAMVGKHADELGLDAELAATLLRSALLPALEQISRAARPLRPAAVWNHGYCPTCGSWPLLGEYRGLELTRFLRCGLCADEWPIDRMMCYVCGSRSQSDLHYLEVDGEQLKQRVHACDQCHSYVKQLSTFGSIDAPSLLVSDLQSLHLDLIALERGYDSPR